MKNAFKFPMLRYERVLGILYIPIHSLVLPFLLGIFIALTGAKISDSHLTLISYAVGFLFVLCAMFRFLRTSFSDLAGSLIRSLQALVLAFLLYYLLNYIAHIIILALSGDLTNPNQAELESQVKINRNVMLVVSVLLAPVMEEALFRGALFGTLRQKSRALAYIISAAAFALYHIWPYLLGGIDLTLALSLIQYVPASIALAWCYERSGNIWTPMVLHAVSNFLVLYIQVG